MFGMEGAPSPAPSSSLHAKSTISSLTTVLSSGRSAKRLRGGGGGGLRDIGTRIGESGLRLDLSCLPGLLDVEGDDVRLFRSLLSLLDLARPRLSFGLRPRSGLLLLTRGLLSLPALLALTSR